MRLFFFWGRQKNGPSPLAGDSHLVEGLLVTRATNTADPSLLPSRMLMVVVVVDAAAGATLPAFKGFCSQKRT